jgi:anion transporter
MFITEPIPLGVTGLLGCWLYWVWAGIPVAKAFSGFHMDTPWFILGVMLLGVMAETTGLAKRVAYRLVCGVSGNYASILASMMVVNFLLTFIIPSAVAKCLIICAMSISLVQSYGLSKGSNVGRGLLLAMTYQSGLFDKVILAGAGNILARGIIESVGKVKVSYGLWLLAYLPITVLTLVACWWIILKLFPPEKKMLEGGQDYCRSELKKMGPMTTNEIKALLFVCVATVLWATDHWHHISASVIGVIIGLIACLPLIGALKKEDFAKANFPIVIFVGSAMCLGNVMADSEILKTLTAALFKWMTPILHSASITSAMLLYWYANLFHLFLANETAMVGATMPALMQFAVKDGFNPLSLGMLWAFAAGGKVFVYQSAVMAVGYAFGYFSARDLFKFGLAVFFVESILLLIIIPWYWPLLGLSFR